MKLAYEPSSEDKTLICFIREESSVAEAPAYMCPYVPTSPTPQLGHVAMCPAKVEQNLVFKSKLYYLPISHCHVLAVTS